MDINDLYQGSKNATDTGFAPNLGHEELPEGVPVLVEAVYTKAGLTPAEQLKLTVKFKVIEDGHPHQGGEFFDSPSFSVGESEGQKSYNKRLFSKLEGAGLGESFFATSPSYDAIATAVKGTKLVFTPRWQEPKKNQKTGEMQVWLDNTSTWAPAPGSGGVSSTGF